MASRHGGSGRTTAFNSRVSKTNKYAVYTYVSVTGFKLLYLGVPGQGSTTFTFLGPVFMTMGGALHIMWLVIERKA